MNIFKDADPMETREWLEAFEAVANIEGKEKARYLLKRLLSRASEMNADAGLGMSTPYKNTISPEESAKMPAQTSELARRVASYVRWNAMAMVAKANKKNAGIGGHIATFASSATIYEVAFNYFFNGPQAADGADLIFFQGHGSPGMYARAFLEGRLTEKDLNAFREESGGKGLSSYPHPWLMPDFWRFPTVSMGLGPIMAIYQARFMKYMENRGLLKIGNKKVWAFLGDGETDEPESLGALGIAGRETLDNLIFVINCNLQRLDGPVRGNGKIIQHLEGHFRGAGWNVIKVIWGSEWDALFAKDKDNVLANELEAIVDGDFQRINAHYKDGAYMRKHLFERNPELKSFAKDLTDEQMARLSRGGHDPRKVYAALSHAMSHKGRPTVVLFQTVKGFGMAGAGEGANATHGQKNMDLDSLKKFRDRFRVPVEDKDLEKLPFLNFAPESDEAKYIYETKKARGGSVLARQSQAAPLKTPGKEEFKPFLESSGDRQISTTMAYVRMISTLLRNKNIGKHIVPIIPDEARTFGMEGLFRQVGIYAPVGQLYEPMDADTLMWYKEDKSGQLLEEGINEAGAFSSWVAAATSYSNYGIPMIPFYIYYSMFGFQRIGDLAWAAGDIRARGFLLGATSGRTTLNGEGLQHQDGQGPLQAAIIPSCEAYDPAFSYELAVILQDGLERMYAKDEDIFYYITLYNENYAHPEMPKGAEKGIRKGMYLFRQGKASKVKVQLMGSGSIFQEVLAAADILKDRFDVESDIWSIPGINQLSREGAEAERWNLLNPDKPAKIPYITELLREKPGPVVISTDYVRAYPEQVRRFIPNQLTILGTDGYGRSDTREALRDFFEIDRNYIVLAALKGLAEQGSFEKIKLKDAVKKLGLKGNKPNPLTE